MIPITVNGEVREVRAGLTAAELIAELELTNRRFAVEINEAVLPRSRLTEYRIRSGDRIEIVHAIGGG
ncbi:MAG: sulfur carrier protein ThiS [Nitrococcus mobilis]|nr:sulfur carrier protein ThiS [Nitrococcus mobilis]